MEALGLKLLAGVTTTLGLFWDSLYGLIFGFLISAIAQVVIPRGPLERALGPGIRGIANGTVFGIVSSACSYGAAAAARGFYAKGADPRAVYAFMISSTNMNVAILIMFWAMLGWRFAYAEFFGGLIIIAVVTGGASLFLGPGPASTSPAAEAASGIRVTECLQCGMKGERKHAARFEDVTYLFCGSRHKAQFRAAPRAVLNAYRGQTEGAAPRSLREASTWRSVLDTMLADVQMLRNELIVGFVVAGFAAALIPPQWLAAILRSVASVPLVGYPLLLIVGLLLAVCTFVCSMGNVPIARFLALAGIPLGANITFVYGDLLIPPLIGIYRKSFPPKMVWTFLGLFTLGALIAGAIVDVALGHSIPLPMERGSATSSDLFTRIANVLALVALATVFGVSRFKRVGVQRSLQSRRP